MPRRSGDVRLGESSEAGRALRAKLRTTDIPSLARFRPAASVFRLSSVARDSAGILGYRTRAAVVEVLLVHPGGPFWKNKDDGAWSIPKGELEPGEDPLAAALREFTEETGAAAEAPYHALGSVRLKSGKRVFAWSAHVDIEVTRIVSSTFELEWPPRSGRVLQFPEVDRAEYFTLEMARRKLNPAQSKLIDELEARLLGPVFPAPT